VITATNLVQARCAQRRDRDRPRIVGIVFVRSARAQPSHSCRQRHRHIHDQFTRRDELLAQQIPEAARRLDRPGSLFEPCCPTQQLVDLTSSRTHHHRCQLDFVAINRDSSVRPLVRIDTDHHRREHLPIDFVEGQGGHS
jgi:hypothetical protein